MSTLGQKLKHLRKQNDLSQKDVAKHLKITVSALSQYETDKRTPKNDALVILAKLYHTSTDYLLGITPLGASEYQAGRVLMAATESYHDDGEHAGVIEQEKQLLIHTINAMPVQMQAQVITSINALLQTFSMIK